MSYKRAAGSIFYAIGAAVALLLDWPGQWLEPGESISYEIQRWMRFVLVATAAGLPFDFLGLSSRDRHSGVGSEDGVKALIRGYMLLAIAYVAIGAVSMAATNAFGTIAGLFVLAAVVAFLGLFQYYVLIIAARTNPKERVITVASSDSGPPFETAVRAINAGVKDFTGGFAGLFRLRRLVFPEQELAGEETILPRRKSRYWLYEAARGYRLGAMVLYLLFFVFIVTGILVLPGTGLDSAAAMARFSLWSTLVCSVVGLALLGPYQRITRLGFLMRRRGRPWLPMRFYQDIPHISLEPKRPGVPYPDGSTFLSSATSTFRLGHYLSWGILNLAARLHPLVIGHPALWVLPPDERTLQLASTVTEEQPLAGRRL